MHLRLLRWLHESGLGSVSYQVVDPCGTVLSEHEPSTPRRGASTTKLLTVDAALRTLGPDHRFRLEITQHDQALYLRGVHPWLQTQELLELVASVRRGAPRLYLDDNRYPRFELPPGWPSTALPLDVQPVMPINLREYFGYDPSAAAAEAIAGLLTATGHETVYSGRARSSGTVVGHLDSNPLRDLAAECLRTSHNLMAEILGRESAIALGHAPTFDSMQATLTESLTTDTAGVQLLDASGLGTDNRIRADVLIHVLRRPVFFDHGLLPLAGLTGTLSAVNDWFQTGPAAEVRGYVQAKSGTHHDCVALAGFTYMPQRPVRVFAILVDHLPGPSPHLPVRRAVEEFTHLVASG